MKITFLYIKLQMLINKSPLYLIKLMRDMINKIKNNIHKIMDIQGKSKTILISIKKL